MKNSLILLSCFTNLTGKVEVCLLFLLVRISKLLYAKLSSTCIQLGCMHLLKSQHDPWRIILSCHPLSLKIPGRCLDNHFLSWGQKVSLSGNPPNSLTQERNIFVRLYCMNAGLMYSWNAWIYRIKTKHPAPTRQASHHYEGSSWKWQVNSCMVRRTFYINLITTNKNNSAHHNQHNQTTVDSIVMFKIISP